MTKTNNRIVDRARLDERGHHAGGHQVDIGMQLLIQPHDAFLFVLTHLEPDDRERHAGRRGRIDVLHAGDLPQEFLHRLGDALFHFACRRAGHRHEHVDHRHDDLRFLFARQADDREQAEDERRADKQRRQFGIDERLGDLPGDPEIKWLTGSFF